MMISEELRKRNIFLFRNKDEIPDKDRTLIGKFLSILPADAVEIIIDFVDIRFTNYFDGYGSNYFIEKIKGAKSWEKWRERNNLPLYYACKKMINNYKKFGRREIEIERLSKLIYGF